MGENYPEIPEYIKKILGAGKKLDEIKIDRDGNWFHNGDPFTNKKIIDLFNRSIDVTKLGIYVIRYEKFVYPILVEDVPIFISGVRFEGKKKFEKALITPYSGCEETLDVTTLLYHQNGALYCSIKNGKLPARFRRSPAFQILDRLEENDDTYYLNIGGKKVVLAEKMEGE